MEKIMKSLINLKGKRESREKAKTANDQEPADSKYVYRVEDLQKTGGPKEVPEIGN